MVHERAVIPESGKLAMIPARRLGDRYEFGLTGAAASHRKHQHRLCGEDTGLAILRALDIGAEPLVVADDDLITICAERPNRIEMMIVTEVRLAIPTDDLQKQLVLSFFRVGRKTVPVSPLAARQERGGFEKNPHWLLSKHFVLGCRKALQGIFFHRHTEAAGFQ